MTISVSPTTLSYGRGFTVSGTDTGLYPDGSTGPVDGQAIEVGLDTVATTNASGQFSFTLQGGIGAGLAATSGMEVDAVPDATTEQAYSNFVPTTVVQDPVRFTTRIEPSVQAYGSTANLAGNLSYESGSQWLPLGNVEIDAYGAGCLDDIYCATPPPDFYGTTDSTTGNFSIPMQVQLPYRFQVAPQSPAMDSGWLSQPQAVLTETVRGVPVSVQADAQRRVDGKIGISGCDSMAGSYNTPVVDPAALPVLTVQYSRSRHGPWTTIDTRRPKSSLAYCFYVVVRSPHGRPYYRVRSATSEAYKGMTTAAFGAVGVVTSKITSLTASPRTVASGHRVHLVATLRFSREDIDPRPLKAQVLFRAADSASWHVVKTVGVTSPGTGGYQILAGPILRHSGYLKVRFLGNSYIEPTTSRSVFIRVT